MVEPRTQSELALHILRMHIEDRQKLAFGYSVRPNIDIVSQRVLWRMPFVKRILTYKCSFLTIVTMP